MATITRTPDEVVEALSASCLPCELAAAQAEEAELTEPETPARWEGILTYEGQMTGDGRVIEKGALRWDTLPIPLRWVQDDVGAHAGATVVGRITEIERQDDGAIWAAGDFDLGSEKGREAARQVQEGLTPGVSVDLDDVNFEVRVAADNEIENVVDDIDEDGRVKRMAMKADDEITITTAGRIRAATLVAIPAFEPARLAIAASGHISLTASAAALLASYNPDQLRVPKGNGDLSGRWLDMPSSLIDDLLDAFGDADQGGLIRQAQDMAQAADEVRYTDSAKHNEYLDNAKEFLVRASEEVKGGDNRSQFDDVVAQIDDVQSVDWGDAPSPPNAEDRVPGGPEGPDLPVGPNRDIIPLPELPPDVGDEERQAEIDTGLDEAGNPISTDEIVARRQEERRKKLAEKQAVNEKKYPVGTKVQVDVVTGAEGTRRVDGEITDHQGGFLIVSTSTDGELAVPPDKLILDEGVAASALVLRTQRFRDVDAKERKKLSKEGNALPDGSFPIANVQDLKNAIQAVGRAKDPDAAKRHIRKRARELNSEGLIPDSWAVDLWDAFDLVDDYAFATTYNWVEDVGGLPQYIKRISKHLRKKGMTESHAIATAVNVVKKACATGDLNFPGVQQENAGSRAEACAAVADWERKKAQAAGETQTFGFNPEQMRVPKGNGELSGRWVDMPGTTLKNLMSGLGELWGTAKKDDLPGGAPDRRIFDPEIKGHQQNLNASLRTLEDTPVGNVQFDAAAQRAEADLAALEATVSQFADDLDRPGAGKSDEYLRQIQEARASIAEFRSVDWLSDPNFDPANPAPDATPDAGGGVPDLLTTGSDWLPEPPDVPLDESQRRQIQQASDKLLDTVGKDPNVSAEDKGKLKAILSKVPTSSLDFYVLFQKTIDWLREVHEKYVGGSDDADFLATTVYTSIYDYAELAMHLLTHLAEHSGRTITAGAFPLQPPAAWFSDPTLTGPTPLKVDSDGRVYGHLAVWGTCHTGYPNRCVTAPSSQSGYAYFRVGSVFTDDGGEVPVGRITMDTLHAGKDLSGPASLAHYENTGRAVADVAVGEDAYGIWVAGSLRPGVTDEQARTLRGSPLSGDWRRVGNSLELVAALAVNVPGFPIPRPSGIAAGGAMRTLVAAGMLSPALAEPLAVTAAEEVLAGIQHLSSEDVAYLKQFADRERQIITDEAALLALEVDITDFAHEIKI